MNPRMLCKKLLNFFTAVNRAPIPQQDHGVPDMFKQLFKERTNIQTVKIPRPEPEVERQAFPFRRYHQCIDGGNPVLFVEVIEDRGLSFRSPGATNVWDEQEARLIDEDQTGPKSFGFFLYGATGKLSNGQSLSRFFVKHGALVSDNSIPSPEVTATHDWGDTGCQSVCGWFGRSVSKSKGLSDILRPADPTRVLPPICFSRFETAWEDALESPLNEGPWTRPLGTLGTIGKQSSLMLPSNAQQMKELSCLLSVTRSRVDGASPVPLGIHGVSCPLL
jgi:hypothetical protein